MDAEQVALARGRGVIHADRCGAGGGTALWAHARLPGVVVTVDMPICTRCVRRRDGPGAGYDTRAGLRTVLCGLERRPAA